jgi:hypothetical protein
LLAIAAEHNVAWVPTDLGLDDDALLATAAPAPRGFSVPEGRGSGVAQAYSRQQACGPLPPQEGLPPTPGHTPNGAGPAQNGAAPAAAPSPSVPPADYHAGYKDGFAAAARAQGGGSSGGGSNGSSGGSGGSGSRIPTATVVGRPINSSSSSLGAGGGGAVAVALPFAPSAGDRPLKADPSRLPRTAGRAAAEELEFECLPEAPRSLPAAAALPAAWPAAAEAAAYAPLPPSPSPALQPPSEHQWAPSELNEAASVSAELDEELSALSRLPPAAPGSSGNGAQEPLDPSGRGLGGRTASLSLEEMQARLAGLVGREPGLGGGGGALSVAVPDDMPPEAPGSGADDNAAPPSDYDSLMSRFDSLKN